MPSKKRKTTDVNPRLLAPGDVIVDPNTNNEVVVTDVHVVAFLSNGVQATFTDGQRAKKVDEPNEDAAEAAAALAE